MTEANVRLVRFSAPRGRGSRAPARARRVLLAGGFPRQMALGPNGRTLLVTDFGSQRLGR